MVDCYDTFQHLWYASGKRKLLRKIEENIKNPEWLLKFIILESHKSGKSGQRSICQTLQRMNPKLLGDEYFMCYFVMIYNGAMEYLSDSLKSSEQFLIKLMSFCPKLIKTLKKSQLSAKICLSSVTSDPFCWRYLPRKFQQDRQVIDVCIKHGTVIFFALPREYQDDINIVTACIDVGRVFSSSNFNNLSDKFKLDREIIARAVSKNTTIYHVLDKSLRSDLNLFKLACKNNICLSLMEWKMLPSEFHSDDFVVEYYFQKYSFLAKEFYQNQIFTDPSYFGHCVMYCGLDEATVRSVSVDVVSKYLNSNPNFQSLGRMNPIDLEFLLMRLKQADLTLFESFWKGYLKSNIFSTYSWSPHHFNSNILAYMMDCFQIDKDFFVKNEIQLPYHLYPEKVRTDDDIKLLCLRYNDHEMMYYSTGEIKLIFLPNIGVGDRNPCHSGSHFYGIEDKGEDGLIKFDWTDHNNWKRFLSRSCLSKSFPIDIIPEKVLLDPEMIAILSENIIQHFKSISKYRISFTMTESFKEFYQKHEIFLEKVLMVTGGALNWKFLVKNEKYKYILKGASEDFFRNIFQNCLNFGLRVCYSYVQSDGKYDHIWSYYSIEKIWHDVHFAPEPFSNRSKSESKSNQDYYNWLHDDIIHDILRKMRSEGKEPLLSIDEYSKMKKDDYLRYFTKYDRKYLYHYLSWFKNELERVGLLKKMEAKIVGWSSLYQDPSMYAVFPWLYWRSSWNDRNIWSFSRICNITFSFE